MLVVCGKLLKVAQLEDAFEIGECFLQVEDGLLVALQLNFSV